MILNARTLRRGTAVALMAIVTAVLLAPANAVATPTLVDSYDATNYNSVFTVASGSSPYLAQTFIASAGGTLDSAQFYLRKAGAPSGNVTAYLYDATGTLGTSSIPTGAPLAASTPVDITTIAGGSNPSLVTFLFGNAVSLSAGTNYAIVISYGGGDVSNALLVCGDSTAPSHSGNPSYRMGAGSWLTWPTGYYDLIFYVYATPPTPPGPTSTPASSPWSLLVAGVAAIGVAHGLTRRGWIARASQ